MRISSAFQAVDRCELPSPQNSFCGGENQAFQDEIILRNDALLLSIIRLPLPERQNFFLCKGYSF
jgi:hypothetical protein